MPKGQDFLNTLDEMLFEDDSQTSKRVRNMCSKCHSLDATTFHSKYGANFAVLNGCNACVRTQIIGWNEDTKKYIDIGL
tara:strand:+ start:944 stop:1180 length:237 start_codon:yes stop_codon:yes gene_type:complete